MRGLLFYCLFTYALLGKAAVDADDLAVSTLRLSQAKQTLAGIKTQPLTPSQYQPELQATARVVDLQALLMLREQYFAAQTEVQSANAALALIQQAVNRTRALYQNGVNSKRQLQEQQITQSAAQARVTSSQYRLQSINDTLTTQWGSTLSAWAKANGNKAFSALVDGQQALLLVSAPVGLASLKNKQIVVSASGDRQAPQLASFIAAAPQGGELNQGETYFFKTERANLRTGMRLSAWIAKPQQLLTGFTIPSTALIWHTGQATLYIKTAPEQFQRVTVTDYHPISQGYYVTADFPEHAEVVSIGAQTLLSEELHGMIPEEDADGDD